MALAAQLYALPVTVNQTVLELYGTGIRGHTAPVTCTIGGVSAPVSYAGAQGQYAGLDQVNVSLPASLAGRGQVDIVLTVDGQVSNTVTMNGGPSRLASSTGLGYYMKGGACYSTATGQTADLSSCDVGTFFRIAAEIPPSGASASCPSVTNSNDTSQSKCLDRFSYDPHDPIAQWINLNASGSSCGGSASPYPTGDIEITIFDAWTVDILQVSCVDTANHIVYFTGAAKGNAGVYNFFGPTAGHRYIVENTGDAFDDARAAGQTGIWFLDRSVSPWVLNYLANHGENPNTDAAVIPQVQAASATGGSLLSAVSLSYVNFTGIVFEMDAWTIPANGFADDENGENTLPAAIDCESCEYVTFDGVTVRHTAASGLQIASTSGNSGTPAANDVIQNSAFYDIGSSGIHIGHHPLGSDRAANVVQFVTVGNNIVQGYSRVFADGEGLAQGNGHDISYLHNDVTDGYHAGISICNLGCPSVGFLANGTNILSQYNHIWNVIQGITADGGTLYYNVGSAGGSGPGNRILSNLVHDVSDSLVIDAGVKGSGYGGSGIYLDAQSAGVDVENNVVFRVTGPAIHLTQGPAAGQPGHSFRNNIFALARTGMFDQQQPWTQGCGSASSPQITFLNNLFYFDFDDSTGFYVQLGCANSCGLAYNQFQNFQGNLYWRTDGRFSGYSKAFHVLTRPQSGAAASACSEAASPNSAWTFLTFAQWQTGTPLVNGSPLAMNEDPGGTVSVDPGFGAAALPGDFLLSRGPVAGFDYTLTNDTILHAGRTQASINPPAVPHTYPTFYFSRY